MGSSVRTRTNTRRCFYITSITKFRIPFFMVTIFRDTLIRGIEYFRGKYGFKLPGYVVMPDHFHGLFVPRSADSISCIVRDIKAYSGREISRVLGDRGGVWEGGFEKHEISSRDDYETALENMHKDPLRRQIVRVPEDYPYSSCRYYLSGEEGPLRIDDYQWES